MKKILTGFLLALVLVVAVAATMRNAGFFITGDYGGEPIIGAEQNNQVADWLRFTSNGVPIFSVPSSGIIPLIYGGTGTTNGAITTNSSPFNTVTNDVVTGGRNVTRNQRGTFTVSIVGTSAPSGVEYSNASSGQVRTFLCSLGDTNTVTIRFQPNSIISVTNATVLPNTSEINYE